jgi:dephospho-CoA kinase
MYLVGLTGGIGTGKSSVAERLAVAGAVIVDADRIVHELQQPGTAVFDEMVELLGPTIVMADGGLNRAAVAEVVFHDAEKLAALNQIVHPRVRAAMAHAVLAQADTDNVVVVDIPLLREGIFDGLAGVIVVDLDPEVAVARLVEHRGFSESDARARIAAQSDREERLALATWVIDNSGNPAELHTQVEALWGELTARRDAAVTPPG